MSRRSHFVPPPRAMYAAELGSISATKISKFPQINKTKNASAYRFCRF